MLLNRQKFWPRSITGEASEILARILSVQAVYIARTSELNGIRAGFPGSHAQGLFELKDPNFPVA